MSSHSQEHPATTTRKPITLHRLRELYTSGEKLTMLTCYDATFARVLDEAGVEMLLVGDSLGMVLQGRTSTLPVTLDEMAYHVRSVAAGNKTAGSSAIYRLRVTSNQWSLPCKVLPRSCRLAHTWSSLKVAAGRRKRCIF